MLTIPTTQELADQNLTRLEAALGQTSPVNERAFLRVLAVMEALYGTGLYKLSVEQAKQNLALTATGSDLDLIGAEYETVRKPAVATVLTVTLPAINGTSIPLTSSFIAAANGVRYYSSATVIAAAGVATLSLTAEVVGVTGNLQVGDTLTIVSGVAGAENTATVTVVDTVGADRETDTAYRPRVRFAMRAMTGGSNATDHKIWAESVAGVLRAYPYSGKPIGGGTSYPGDRTIYVEADSGTDGIPAAGLLTSVRDAINTDPTTGKSRPALGLVDSTLWVEPITRTALNVTITTLVYLAGTEATVKTAISSALTAHMLAMTPWVDGVDLIQDRNDLVTDLVLSQVVQNVLDAYGASASEVAFDIAAVPKTTYQLSQGETAKLGTVTYAV
jgi:uncharacterized phage protein gp47/JayE